MAQRRQRVCALIIQLFRSTPVRRRILRCAQPIPFAMPTVHAADESGRAARHAQRRTEDAQWPRPARCESRLLRIPCGMSNFKCMATVPGITIHSCVAATRGQLLSAVQACSRSLSLCEECLLLCVG
eukprot:5894867-Pleurochrysis_carterae.AAC.3